MAGKAELVERVAERTGEEIEIAASRSLAFKASK